MTEQEYQDKMSRYQKKIRFHREAIKNIEKKMDRMESDRQQAMLKVGEYIRYRYDKSMSVSYMKVNKFDTRNRGFRLAGTGFNYTNGRLSYINAISCGWGELSNIVTITKEEYVEAMNKVLNEFKVVAQTEESES